MCIRANFCAYEMFASCLNVTLEGIKEAVVDSACNK